MSTAMTTSAGPRQRVRVRSASLDLSPRRVLQLALGVIWLLDAALQYQPYMFTKQFVTQAIEPSAAGNPGAVSQSVTWAAHLMVHHIAFYNAIFATIQLLLALGILFRPTLKPALAASIVWALFVWWFGEGLGGALIGATPVMGGPGGAVLYALIALVLWPRGAVLPSRAGASSPAEAGLLGERGAQMLWLLLWGSFTWYLLLPGNRAPGALESNLAGMAPGEPRWIWEIEHHLADVVGHDGTEWSLVLAVVCGVVALGIFARPAGGPARRAAVIVAVLLGAAFWVAQAFGEIFTGSGTDPNSGLLLILLAACYWPYGVSRYPWSAATAT